MFDGDEIEFTNYVINDDKFINKYIEFNSDNINKFIICCQNGYLDEAKKLYNINITSDIINKVFQDACLFGRLDIAKWLYSMKNKPVIYDNNCIAFTNASFYGHLDILRTCFK